MPPLNQNLGVLLLAPLPASAIPVLNTLFFASKDKWVNRPCKPKIGNSICSKFLSIKIIYSLSITDWQRIDIHSEVLEIYCFTIVRKCLSFFRSIFSFFSSCVSFSSCQQNLIKKHFRLKAWLHWLQKWPWFFPQTC